MNSAQASLNRVSPVWTFHTQVPNWVPSSVAASRQFSSVSAAHRASSAAEDRNASSTPAMAPD